MSRVIRWGRPPENISNDSRCPFPHQDYHKERKTLGPPYACRLHRWANRRWYEGLKRGMSL